MFEYYPQGEEIARIKTLCDRKEERDRVLFENYSLTFQYFQSIHPIKHRLRLSTQALHSNTQS